MKILKFDIGDKRLVHLAAELRNDARQEAHILQLTHQGSVLVEESPPEKVSDQEGERAFAALMRELCWEGQP